MSPGNSDRPQTTTPAKVPRLDRFAHWLERRTRTDYEADKPSMESDGLVLTERLVPMRVILTRMGAFRIFWAEATIVVTRERFRIYSGGMEALVDVSLKDSHALRHMKASIDGSGKLYLRVAKDIGQGRNVRARVNRRIRITTPHASDILDLIRDARFAVLGNV